MEHVFGPDFMGVDPSSKHSNIRKSQVFCLDKIDPWFFTDQGMKFVVLSVWGVEVGVAIFACVVITKDFSPNDAQNELRGT